MKKSFILGFATLVLLTGGNVYADGPTVSGFGNIWTTLSHDDAKKELETQAAAEVDFEKTAGKSTVRLDVDLAKASIGSTNGVTIEQAKFTRGLGESASLTGGRFNAPIKFEKKDAPDKLQFSNGQLFNLAPSDLDGVMFSWWGGPLAVDAYIANDWRGQSTSSKGYDNSLGGRAKLKAGPANVALAYITSERDKDDPTPGSGDVKDLVVSGTAMHTLLAFEYLTDDHNDGWGITANHKHGTHGVTLRYDVVENTPTGSPTSTETKSATVALTCAMWESVGTVLELRQDDKGAGGKTDVVTLQWVASF